MSNAAHITETSKAKHACLSVATDLTRANFRPSLFDPHHRQCKVRFLEWFSPVGILDDTIRVRPFRDMDVETTVSLGRSTVGESILHVKKSVRGGLQPTILCCAERTKKKRFARVNGPMFCLPHAVSCRLNPESMQQPPAPIKNAKKRGPSSGANPARSGGY